VDVCLTANPKPLMQRR